MYIDSELTVLIVVIFAIYGFYTMGRKLFEKLKKSSMNTEEKRQNVFNALKIFFIGVIVATILYMTPAINETLKIIISLVLTLGTVGAVVAQEDNKEQKVWLRPVLFMGQMFFGITMFLMLVNTNMGYSETAIFIIWSVANFIIAMQYKNIENKLLCLGTIIAALITIIGPMSIDLEMSAIVIVICTILILLQIFGKKDNIFVQITHNVLTLGLIFTYINYFDDFYRASLSSMDDFVMLGVTLIFLIATLAINMFMGESEKINFKAFAIYLPLLTTYLLVGAEEIEEELILIFEMFNLLIATWLLADKSIFKKILTIIVL